MQYQPDKRLLARAAPARDNEPRAVGHARLSLCGRGGVGVVRWGLAVAAFALLMGAYGASTRAVELCSAQAADILRRVGISEEQIRHACELAQRNSAPLALGVRRAEDQSGYCRVTLVLRNNTVLYLNQLTLTTVDSRFDIFHFSDILPGDKGYASANSRILLNCDELDELKMEFHWPISLRIGDRSLVGQQLARYRPLLLSTALRWKE